MAGTDRNREAIEEGPAVILVEPQLGENIGMVARAMANFGLIDLRIVNPRDGWPNDKAEATASGAGYVLARARLYDDLPAALADLTYVVATTARRRDGFKRVLGPGEASAHLRARFAAGQPTGMLFGRERFGLFNEEVGLADDIVTFPVNPAYASLNIAQAVLLMAYEFLKTRTDQADNLPFAGPEFAPAPRAELIGLFEQVEAALDARGYLRPPERKPAQIDNLRAVLSRPGFSVDEIRLLRGVVSSLDRFSPQAPRGQGSPGDDSRRRPANPPVGAGGADEDG
ncbi:MULTISPECIES: RNA methyltransferase [unclassified Roseitalea]|uniref:RNA methyltransferase n=1 Tax=unclassified Roseitalea TaxID=2639107 RepID=UPI00273F0EBD|nr:MULTISPECIES: RNA methyltransferase [unclassified Roseitalea]